MDNKIQVIALVIILVVALAAIATYFGISNSLTGKSVANAQKKTVNIGIVLPLTGPSSDGGAYTQKGLLIAQEELNNRNSDYLYNLIFEDSQYDPKQAVSALKKLIDVNQIKYIIGAHGSSETLAMAPVSEQNKVIQISAGSQSDSISTAGDYIFRTQINLNQEAEFFASKLAARVGTEKIDFLTINTDYGKSFIQDYTTRLEKLGVKIGSVQKFASNEKDYRTLLLKIKEDGTKFVLLGTVRQSAGLILKQAKELNVNAKFFTTSVAEGQEMLDTAGDAAEGVIYPYPYDDTSANQKQDEFRQKYLAKYSEVNEMLSTNGYDALNVLALCIEKTGDNSEKVKDCLYQIKDYEGASGTFSFDSNGDVTKSFITKMVRNGKFVKLG